MDTTGDPHATVHANTSPYVPAPVDHTFPVVPGYEVLELIGRGGMGRVYRARHLGLGRTVALKLLLHEADEHLLARFREEARAVARLQHPNIAQLYESGSADGRPYFAQEFLDGGSLAQALAGRPQPPRDAAQLVETIARAVHHSHSQGVLHRDLKPGNILLGKKADAHAPAALRISDCVPKVVDFGLAKPLDVYEADTKPDSGGALTRTGEILGTPSYMPPEQASGVVTNIGPAADVYALGAVLYETLTGRPPFQAPDVVQTLMLVLTREPVAPRALQPEVPRDLETICLKCLEKSPKKRYESARELADDLRRFLDGRPIVARPVGALERAAKWARRKKAAAALVAVSAVAGALLAAAGVALGIGYFRLERVNQNLEAKNTELEQANADVRAEKERAERQKEEKGKALAVTLVTLDRQFFDVADQLKDVPGTELIRLEILKKARRTLDGLAQFLTDDPEIQNFRMEGYDKLGTIESALGMETAAELSFTRSRDLAAGLEARFPDNLLYPRNRALAVTKLAALNGRRGDVQTADALLDSVAPVAEALAAAHPNDVKMLELQSAVRLHQYGREMRLGKWDRLEPLMRERCALYRRLATANPESPARQHDVIDGDRELATLLVGLGKSDEAGALLRTAAEQVDKLPDRTSVPARRLRASVQSALGDYHANGKRWPQAVAAYTAAATEYDGLAREFTRQPGYRYQQAGVLYALANPTGMTGDVNGAVAHLEKAEKLLADLTREYPDTVPFRELHGRVSNLLKTIRTPPKPPDPKP